MQVPKAECRTATAPKTLELLQGVFDDGTRKPITVSQYCSHVVRLIKGLYGPESDIHDFEWLKNADRVIDYFAQTYPDKLLMQATGLNPLLVVVKKQFPENTDLHQTYYKRYQTIRDLMEKAKPPPQVMSQSEYKNWKTLDQINERRIELQRKVNRYILPKSPEQLTIADKVTLIRHLVLCLYTYSPAVRNDFSQLPIVRFEDMHGAAAKILMAGTGNYLLEYANGQFQTEGL